MRRNSLYNLSFDFDEHPDLLGEIKDNKLETRMTL